WSKEDLNSGGGAQQEVRVVTAEPALSRLTTEPSPEPNSGGEPKAQEQEKRLGNQLAPVVSEAQGEPEGALSGGPEPQSPPDTTELKKLAVRAGYKDAQAWHSLFGRPPEELTEHMVKMFTRQLLRKIENP